MPPLPIHSESRPLLRIHQPANPASDAPHSPLSLNAQPCASSDRTDVQLNPSEPSSLVDDCTEPEEEDSQSLSSAPLGKRFRSSTSSNSSSSQARTEERLIWLYNSLQDLKRSHDALRQELHQDIRLLSHSLHSFFQEFLKFRSQTLSDSSHQPPPPIRSPLHPNILTRYISASLPPVTRSQSFLSSPSPSLQPIFHSPSPSILQSSQCHDATSVPSPNPSTSDQTFPPPPSDAPESSLPKQLSPTHSLPPNSPSHSSIST